MSDLVRDLVRLKYPERQPTQSEDEFFRRPEGKNVSGYAAPDGTAVLNPHMPDFSEESKGLVHANEAFRHHMRDKGMGFTFPITPQQARYFAGTPYEAPKPDYGPRENGAQKMRGWWGDLPTESGGVMGEYSADFDINGQRVHAPLVVPSLTADERRLIAQEIVTPAMEDKARNWAAHRTAIGKSPFAENHEGRAATHSPPMHARHTILARLLTNDPSAGPYTPEQRAAADRVRASLRYEILPQEQR